MSLAGGKPEGDSGSKLEGDSGSKLEGDSASKLEGDSGSGSKLEGDSGSGSKLEGISGSGSKLEGALLLVSGGVNLSWTLHLKIWTHFGFYSCITEVFSTKDQWIILCCFFVGLQVVSLVTVSSGFIFVWWFTVIQTSGHGWRKKIHPRKRSVMTDIWFMFSDVTILYSFFVFF